MIDIKENQLTFNGPTLGHKLKITKTDNDEFQFIITSSVGSSLYYNLSRDQLIILTLFLKTII